MLQSKCHCHQGSGEPAVESQSGACRHLPANFHLRQVQVVGRREPTCSGPGGPDSSATPASALASGQDN